MRDLIKNASAPPNVSVVCLHCGRMVRLCDALVDPTGPAFKAYYHDGPCAVEAFTNFSVTTKGD